MKVEVPHETPAGWLLLAIGTSLTILGPVFLIVTASYVQLNPFLSGYDVGIQDPPPPLSLYNLAVGTGKIAFFGLASGALVAVLSTRVRVGAALAYGGGPLLLAGAISTWLNLSLLYTLGTIVAVGAVVFWLWVAGTLFNRLLSPPPRVYEPVVFGDSGWHEAADNPELD